MQCDASIDTRMSRGPTPDVIVTVAAERRRDHKTVPLPLPSAARASESRTSCPAASSTANPADVSLTWTWRTPHRGSLPSNRALQVPAGGRSAIGNPINPRKETARKVRTPDIMLFRRRARCKEECRSVMRDGL